MEDDDAPGLAARGQRPGDAGGIDLTRVTHVVFGGGGIRGIAYLGALHAIDDVLKQHRPPRALDWLVRRVRVCAGTSIGALFALFVNLELPLSGLHALLNPDGTPNRQLLPHLSTSALCQLAVDSGGGLHDMVRQLLRQGHYADSVTLAQLYRRSGKLLRCACVNARDGQAVYLDKDTAPEMRVIDAVAASMRLPLVFAPYVDADRGLVLYDGGLADAFPMRSSVAQEECADPATVLGVRSVSDPAVTCPSQYLMSALNAPLVHLERLNFETLPDGFRERVVTICTGDIVGCEFYSGPKECQRLWLLGLGQAYQQLMPRRGELLSLVMQVVLAYQGVADLAAECSRRTAALCRLALPRGEPAAPEIPA